MDWKPCSDVQLLEVLASKSVDSSLNDLKGLARVNALGLTVSDRVWELEDGSGIRARVYWQPCGRTGKLSFSRSEYALIPS